LIYNSSYAKKKKVSKFAGRHQIFMLELVFVNRIIDKSFENILSKLLSYDGHPRIKKGSKFSKQSAGSTNPTLNDCLEYFR